MNGSICKHGVHERNGCRECEREFDLRQEIEKATIQAEVRKIKQEFAKQVTEVVIEDLSRKGDIYQLIKNLLEKGARHD